ncbi:MAG: peptidase, partial [Planctomycetota bacterium]
MALLLGIVPAEAETLVLKNGVELTGTLGKIPSLDNQALATVLGSDGGSGSNLIYVVDDGLRRTFVSTYQVRGPRDDVETLEYIRIKQNVARSGKTVGKVGGIVSAGPFDEFGRRQVRLRTSNGVVPVIQGITAITPRFTRLEGLQAGAGFVWDMRIATSSIPRSTLSRILETHLDPNSEKDRLKMVRLYLQSERYRDAEEELQEAIEQLPNLGDLSQQLKNIRQLAAEQRLNELKTRRDAGQHQLVRSLIPKFPSEGVAGELLLEVQDLQAEYEQQDADMQFVVESLTPLTEEFGEDAFLAELKAELNHHNLARLTDYLRLAKKEDLEPEEKLAVAMSCWLTNGKSRENLAVSRSMWRARTLTSPASSLLRSFKMRRRCSS